MSNLARAIALASTAHEHQVDRGGAPYVLHLMRVMLAAHSEHEQIVAILHDLIEDTDWTLERVAAEGFCPEILRSLERLTHRKGESYPDYIARVKTNRVAARVKLLDMLDNLDLMRLNTLASEDLQRAVKYHYHCQELIQFLGLLR